MAAPIREPLPWFKHDAHRFQFDTAELTLAEKGALIALRTQAWLRGSLPGDEKMLARLLGVSVREVKTVWPKVAPFFHLQDGRLVDPQLEEQRRDAKGLSDRQRARKLGTRQLSLEIEANYANEADREATAVEPRTPPRSLRSGDLEIEDPEKRSMSSSLASSGVLDRTALQELWHQKTGLKGIFVAGLEEAAQRIEACADAGGTLLEIGSRAIAALVAFRDECSPGYKPALDGIAMCRHWSRIEPVLYGREKMATRGPVLVAGLDFDKKGGGS